MTTRSELTKQRLIISRHEKGEHAAHIARATRYPIEEVRAVIEAYERDVKMIAGEGDHAAQ